MMELQRRRVSVVTANNACATGLFDQRALEQPSTALDAFNVASTTPEAYLGRTLIDGDSVLD